MDSSLLESLSGRAVLLPAGVCLMIAGVVMRGLARSAQREQSFRKQGDLLASSSEAPESRQPDAIDRHLEKYLPRYASATLWLGVILTIAAFFR
jgi:hypothetical protein